MINAVIFDLNGVFLQSEKLSERFEKQYGISAEKFYHEMKRILDVARKPGCENSFALWEPVLDKWGLSLSKEKFFDFWFSGEHLVPELFNNIDGASFSWETGNIKPDVKALMGIVEKNGLKTSECLYFDDSEKNIEVAKSLGMKAERYDGFEEARTMIESVIGSGKGVERKT